MASSHIRFTSFPSTSPPPSFIEAVVGAFRAVEERISTVRLAKGLESNEVLLEVGPGLAKLGFDVEQSKRREDTIKRPVFFGENGTPQLNYQIDAYWEQQRCGLEVEAGRSILGNAVYRDLVQAMVMVGVEHLCVAVPNAYKYQSSGRQLTLDCYEESTKIARALFGHRRVVLPFGFTVIGY